MPLFSINTSLTSFATSLLLVPTRGVKTAQCYTLSVWTEPKVVASGGVLRSQQADCDLQLKGEVIFFSTNTNHGDAEHTSLCQECVFWFLHTQKCFCQYYLSFHFFRCATSLCLSCFKNRILNPQIIALFVLYCSCYTALSLGTNPSPVSMFWPKELGPLAQRVPV